jgi:hypothetical protein
MLRSRSLEGNEELSSTYLVKDATLKSEVSIERLGAAVLAGELSIAEARAAAGNDRVRPTEADLEWERSNEWARQVIIERKRLDEEEPDWDLYLEAVRASHGLG